MNRKPDRLIARDLVTEPIDPGQIIQPPDDGGGGGGGGGGDDGLADVVEISNISQDGRVISGNVTVETDQDRSGTINVNVGISSDSVDPVNTDVGVYISSFAGSGTASWELDLGRDYSTTQAATLRADALDGSGANDIVGIDIEPTDPGGGGGGGGGLDVFSIESVEQNGDELEVEVYGEGENGSYEYQITVLSVDGSETLGGPIERRINIIIGSNSDRNTDTVSLTDFSGFRDATVIASTINTTAEDRTTVSLSPTTDPPEPSLSDLTLDCRGFAPDTVAPGGEITITVEADYDGPTTFADARLRPVIGGTGLGEVVVEVSTASIVEIDTPLPTDAADGDRLDVGVDKVDIN